VSGRDLILLGGGLFLVYKSVTELYAKVQAQDEAAGRSEAGHASLARVVVQIGLIDLVFSFDSVLTAVGLADNLLVMLLAVVGAMGLMLAFSRVVADFVNKYPSINTLALSFLVLIGVLLVLEAAHQEVEKGHLYFAMAFSLAVELFNLRQRRNTRLLPGTDAA
jgi:predicted tellurium resistance membrane protein TerC